MKTIKQKLFASRVGIVVLSLAMVIAMGAVALAYYGNSPKYLAESGASIVVNEAQEMPVESLGAVSGPDRYFPIFSDNGVQYAPLNVPMQVATTTLCSIKNPFNATSTLDFFRYNITIGTGTAATLVMATSTLYSATSTNSNGNLVTARTVAANAQDNLVWRPTVGTIGAYGVAGGGEIKNGEYVLLMTEGAGLSGYTYTGTCQAKFIKF